MQFDDEKIAELAREVARLAGEVKRLSAENGRRESELIALRELVEQKSWK